MKRILLVFSLILFTIHCFGQQYSQYNTGTLYDSFENPSRASFTPDSSRKYAFNFFLPNFSVNSFLTGNSQVPLKSRAFLGYYTMDNLKFGENKFNRVNFNANYYAIMFKIFSNLDGNTEMGISAQVKTELRGLFSDESIALFNGPTAFENDHYQNIFNNSAIYQAYHQVSFTYREKINRQLAVGFKLSALMGIRYQKIDIATSALDIDRLNDQAFLTMTGRYKMNYIPGSFTTHDYLPTFRNPGAAIGLGVSFKTRDAFNLQFNLKDLGFIHWSNRSYNYNFASMDTIPQFSTGRRENNIYDAAKNVAKTNETRGGFITPTNSRFEASANKTFWLDYGNQFRYSPTLVLSKEVFFDGFTAALVNPITKGNYTLSLTTAYNNYKLLSVGGQFMIKTPNAEFFVGSERIIPTTRLAMASLRNQSQINKNPSYTSADLFLGVAFKFGPLIEHPLNASYVPTEQKRGFISRIWRRIFGRDEDY
ncbi:DUF5723 family protein [Mucilaginibacter pedocola]|uniref:DUF5723 domain-containing protein n=1 Tax=Mucilaginibacter pedocola TaxID=1792845 RepID=A0A1S9PFD5_9SPHI|nr:DUF5723 family protein [Mucilaginibacter pedocola]OOQ59619.1 hypothetical protein BC343_05495 [Mucilaginibacter pedocola]